MSNIVTLYYVDLLNQYSLWFVNQTKYLVVTTILLKRLRVDFSHSNLWQPLATYSHINLNMCAIMTHTLIVPHTKYQYGPFI